MALCISNDVASAFNTKSAFKFSALGKQTFVQHARKLCVTFAARRLMQDPVPYSWRRLKNSVAYGPQMESYHSASQLPLFIFTRSPEEEPTVLCNTSRRRLLRVLFLLRSYPDLCRKHIRFCMRQFFYIEVRRQQLY